MSDEKTDKLHPWQVNPTELVSTAIEHLHRERDSDNRIAFLLFDVGVETMFKIFLTLPAKTTGTKLAYSKRKEAAEGSFHDLCDGLIQAAGKRLQGINIDYVQHYHSVRNRLYHEGIGITISADQVQEYAQISVDLLKRLLDVDMNDELHKPKWEDRREREKREIEEKKAEIEQAQHSLGQVAAIAIEKVYPQLVLPSFTYDFQNPQHEQIGSTHVSHLVYSEQVIATLEDVKASQDFTVARGDLTALYLSILEPIVDPQKSSDTSDWFTTYLRAKDYPSGEVTAFAFYDEEENEVVVENAPVHEELLEAGIKYVRYLDGISQILKEWSKRDDIAPPPIRRSKRKSRSTVPDGRNYTAFLYQQFFAEVLERLKQARSGVTHASKVFATNWFWFAAGRSGFNFTWSFGRGDVLRAELIIASQDKATNDRAFTALERQKDEIEKEMGMSLLWEPRPDNLQKVIRVTRHAKITDEPKDLEAAKQWAVDTMVKFTDVFTPRIKNL